MLALQHLVSLLLVLCISTASTSKNTMKTAERTNFDDFATAKPAMPITCPANRLLWQYGSTFQA
jgi:hypothetical protein